MAQHALATTSLAVPTEETAAGSRSLTLVLHWLLRIGMAGCFIGHGAFGILTLPPFHLVKASWVSYFAVVGIPRPTAVAFMPWVGALDVGLGILTLIVPLRAAMAWLTFWGIWTALLRPLAGENPYEFIERAGNYGVPFVLLYLSGFGRGVRAWALEAARPLLTLRKTRVMEWLLRGIVALCLIGHGAFGSLVAKSVWFGYLGVFGLTKQQITADNLFGIVGWTEIALGFIVLVLPFRRVAPLRALLLVLPVLKLGFEVLRAPVNEPYALFEVVERTGTYIAPLALFVLYLWLDRVCEYSNGQTASASTAEIAPRDAS